MKVWNDLSVINPALWEMLLNRIKNADKSFSCTNMFNVFAPPPFFLFFFYRFGTRC